MGTRCHSVPKDILYLYCHGARDPSCLVQGRVGEHKLARRSYRYGLLLGRISKATGGTGDRRCSRLLVIVVKRGAAQTIGNTHLRDGRGGACGVKVRRPGTVRCQGNVYGT